jgi:hypothetical protein
MKNKDFTEKHVHLLNWFRPTQTLCCLDLEDRKLSDNLEEITCDVCSLKVLRLGQQAGFNTNNICSWSIFNLKDYFLKETKNIIKKG